MHCKACDREITVKWVTPIGASKPMLESLCNTCLMWASIAMQVGEPTSQNARRKPRETVRYEEDS